jgi:hypothetical protein
MAVLMSSVSVSRGAVERADSRQVGLVEYLSGISAVDKRLSSGESLGVRQ